MTVTEIKHAAKRQEWQERIKECRSSGKRVRQWCEEQQISEATYYRWEREIFGKVNGKGKERQALAAVAPEFVEAPTVRASSVSRYAIMTLRIGKAEVDIYAGASVSEIEAVCRVLKLC